MHRWLITFTAVALALAAPAFGQTQTPPPRSGAPAGNTQSANPDRSFAQQAAAAGAAEVEAGKLAGDRASGEQVKSFARTMVNDHTAANDQLESIARGKGITLSKTPDKAHQDEMKKLSGMNGAAFDRAYVEGQLADHREAVALFERESRSGKDPELKRFAADTLPKLQGHLSMAENLSKTARTGAPSATPAASRAQAPNRSSSAGADDEQARARTAELNRQQFEKARAGAQ